MKLLLLIFFAVFVTYICSNEEISQKSLWDHIVRMEQIVLSVEYNGRRLNVWREDAHGYNRFFVTPLCVLDTSSIKCVPDKYSSDKQNVFSFHLQLWDSEAANTVRIALEEKGFEVKASDIIPLPMQMVRLSINRDDLISDISVDGRWRSYQGQPNGILFELGVKRKTFCDEMVSDAKEDPETFLARTKLHFEFTMFVGQQSYRNVNITGNTVTKSKFFAELVNDYSNKNGFVYLQSDDLNKLARDIYQSLAVQEHVTDDYIPTREESQIVEELLNEIKGQQILSTQLSTEDWDSVFWNDMFSRPDIQTEYFNNVLSYDDDKKHFKYDETKDKIFRGKLEDRFSKESFQSRSGGGGFSFMGFGANAQGGKQDGNKDSKENINSTETKDTNILNKDELENFIDLNNAIVKWTGTKFEAKGLTLHRINTKAMQTSGEIFYKRIVTTKLATTQELPIQVEPKHANGYNTAISPVYFEVFQKAINATNANLEICKSKTNDHFQSIAENLEVLENVTTELEVQTSKVLQLNVTDNSKRIAETSNKILTMGKRIDAFEKTLNKTIKTVEKLDTSLPKVQSNLRIVCKLIPKNLFGKEIKGKEYCKK